MPQVLIHTLGCKLNQLESESFADAFRQAGFSLYDPKACSLTDGGEISPSVIIVNTCTVTSKADQKARRIIRKALRDYPDASVIVTGCYAQMDQTQIKELGKGFAEGRLFVFKGQDKNIILNLPQIVSNKNKTQTSANAEKEFKSMIREVCGKIHICDDTDNLAAFQFAPESFSAHTRSFLKIQDGCNKNCSYCRIRLARGPSISLNSQLALERLRILEANHSETVLTGVNITQYRDEKANNLGELLQYLLSGTAKINLRLSSLEPDSINENFVQILSNSRIRPHFHLSIQSGSEKILKMMNRSYNAEIIEKAVNLLRGLKDDPFLSCDIISGFPGENEAEFNETFDLCRKIGFSWIHVFPFSKRPGTPAWSFKDTVNEKEINKRVQLLTDLAWRSRENYTNRWLGREVDVLAEKNDSPESPCPGISENYLKLLIYYEGDNAPVPGTVLRCRLGKKENNQKKDYDAVAYADT